MNGYVCLWNRQKIEIHAETSYKAQLEAVKRFQAGTRKKVKSHDVTVMLAELNRQQVIHTPS